MSRWPSKQERYASLKPKAETTLPETVEHPEDRQARIEGEAYGKKHAAEFANYRQEALTALIAVYSDDAARDALDAMRDEFWSQAWKPEGK